MEGQRDGIVVEENSPKINMTGISDSPFISWTRLVPILVLLLIGLLLWFIAARILAKTEGARTLAQETEVAKKRLAELGKRRVPPPAIVWVLCASALVLFLSALMLLFFLSSRPGPPFGW